MYSHKSHETWKREKQRNHRMSVSRCIWTVSQTVLLEKRKREVISPVILEARQYLWGKRGIETKSQIYCKEFLPFRLNSCVNISFWIYTRSREIFIFVILVEREGKVGKFSAVFLPLPSSSSWVLFAILFDFDLLFVAHSSRESTSAWGRKSKPLGVNGVYISFFQHLVSHILLRRKGNKQTHAIYREKEFRVTTPTQNFQQQEKEGETFKSDKSLMSFNRNKSKREREKSKRESCSEVKDVYKESSSSNLVLHPFTVLLFYSSAGFFCISFIPKLLFCSFLVLVNFSFYCVACFIREHYEEEGSKS